LSLEDPTKPQKNVNDDKRTDFTFRGKTVVLSKTQGAPFRGLVKKGIEKGMYPEDKRIEAAAIYAATGHLGRTSELTKIPESILSGWRRQDWFQALLREIWQENNEKIDAKSTEIISKSLDAVIDRLDNGDFHVTRDGKLMRKPINAKELSLVHAINVDKRQLLRGLPTSRSESGSGEAQKTVDRLEKLAETFENLAKFGRKPRTIEATEAEVIEIEDKSGAEGATPVSG
jgi:hypothetical protein